MIICGRVIGYIVVYFYIDHRRCTCQDCSVGKVDIIVLEGEEEIIVYAYVDIDDGNSK
jgi:hypothetical protein